MRSTPVIPGGDNSNNTNSMSPKISKVDLRMLSKEDLAKLLSQALSNHPDLASSLVPLSYVKKSKVNNKASVRKGFERQLKKVTSEVGFNNSLKPFSPDEVDSLKTKTFHAFPRLPAELRVMIYKLMFPASRVVKISMIFKDEEGREIFAAQKKQTAAFAALHRYVPLAERTRTSTKYGQYAYEFRSNTKVPITLHINKESRIETLKHFRPIYHTPGQQCTIYSNLSTDTICWEATRELMEGKFLQRVGEHASSRNVQSFAISHYGLMIFMSRPNRMASTKYFCALREILVDLDGVDLSSRTVTPIAYDPGSVYDPERRQRVYDVKLRCMKEGMWVGGAGSEFRPRLLELLDDEVRTAMKDMKHQSPNWKVPTIQFGKLARFEVSERKAALEKELAGRIAELDEEIEAIQ